MNLVTIAAHSFDLDRLPEAPTVLDVGCRGFDFAKGIRALRPKAKIVALDPDPDISFATIGICAFLQFALVGDDRKRSRYASYSTGDGNFLTDLHQWHDAKIIEVDCINITDLGHFTHDYWDLVKLDAEGSEFQILENWSGPIAGQLSVEFHDWHGTHVPKPPEGWAAYYERVFARLATFGYRVARHEPSDISGRGAIGNWDSLLLLEGACKTNS